MWDTEGCPRCDPWPDPLPEAPLLVPDGTAYPGHYKLPPGKWRVQAFEGAPGWEIRLYKPQSKKHDKPWILQLKQVTRIVTSLADFKAPNPPPKLTLV